MSDQDEPEMAQIKTQGGREEEDGTMMKKKEKEEYTEEQIPAEFGTAYDHPRKLEGYLDSEEFPQPHRYITNWYLTKNGNSAGGGSAYQTHEPRLSLHRRYSLPPSNAFSVDYVLRGELEPVRVVPVSGEEEGEGEGEGGAKEDRAIRVVLTALQTWVIDRSSSGRGIWIQSSKAWYMLKEPSSEPVCLNAIVKLSDGVGDLRSEAEEEEDQPKYGGRLQADLPSQYTVHLPLRAKFGLISNVIDVLSERYNDVTHNYIPIHAKRSPESVHSLLSPSADTVRDHARNNNTSGGAPPDENEPGLNSVPFDLDLLRECPSFVRQHLRYYHKMLGSDCKFMQGLLDMIRARRDAAAAAAGTSSRASADEDEDEDDTWDDDAYLRSAEEAEDRGCRTAWGDPLPVWSEGRVRPNRVIDIEIQNAARAAAQAHASSGGGDGGGGGGGEAAGEADASGAEAEGGEKQRQQQGADPEEEDYGDDDDEEDDEEDVGAAMPWQKKKAKTTTGRKRIAEDDDDDDEEDPAPAAKPKPDASSLSYDDVLRGAHSPQAAMSAPPAPKVAVETSSTSDSNVPKLNLTTDPSPSFSPSAMADALSRLSGYLIPTPSSDADEPSSDAEYAKFSVPDENGGAFIEEVVQNPDVQSLELMLLAVESLRRGSGKKVLKGMFKSSKSHPTVAGKVVFGGWLNFVIKVMADRRRKGGNEEALEEGSKRTEEMVASSIMDLIRDFHVIKGAKQIGILKSKFGVDWVGIVDKTLDFATELNIVGVADSSRKAKTHLDSIMQGTAAAETKDKVSATNGHQTIPVKSETSIVSGDMKSPGAQSASSEDAEKLVKEKKEKEEKDRLRRQRMAQMLKTAQSRAGTAAYATGDKAASKGTQNKQQSAPPVAKATEAKKPDEPRTASPPARKTDSAAGVAETQGKPGWGSQSSSWGTPKVKAEGSGWGAASQAQSAGSSGWGKSSSGGSSGGWGSTKPASDPRQGSGRGQKSAAAPSRGPADERESGRTVPTQTPGGRPVSASTQGSSDISSRADQPSRQGPGAELTPDSRWDNQARRPEFQDGPRSRGNDPRTNEPPQDRGRQAYGDRSREQDRGAGAGPYNESQQQRGRDYQYDHQQRQYSGARGSFQGREGNAQQGDRPPAGSYPGMDQPGRQGRQMNRNSGAAEDGEIGGVQHQGRGQKRDRERGNEAWDKGRVGGEMRYGQERPSFPESSHQQRPGDNDMKRRRMDNSGGPGFAQEQPGSNRLGPPAAPNQIQQVGGPQGRGRGRGKAVNLPAWMTKKSDGLGDAGPPSAPIEAPSQNYSSGPDPGGPDHRVMQQGGPQRDQSFQRPQSFPGQQGRFDGDGLGRGGGGGGNRGGGRGFDGGRGKPFRNQGTTGPPPPAPVVGAGAGAGASLGRGRGRGRGKDVNLPAWMTRQEG